jgi:hypothetical protein
MDFISQHIHFLSPCGTLFWHQTQKRAVVANKLTAWLPSCLGQNSTGTNLHGCSGQWDILLLNLTSSNRFWRKDETSKEIREQDVPLTWTSKQVCLLATAARSWICYKHNHISPIVFSASRKRVIIFLWTELTRQKNDFFFTFELNKTLVQKNVEFVLNLDG